MLLRVAFEIALGNGTEGGCGRLGARSFRSATGFSPAAALAMLSRASLRALSTLGMRATAPIVSITALPLTRYIATQLFSPFAVMRTPNPGNVRSQWIARPVAGAVSLSTAS